MLKVINLKEFSPSVDYALAIVEIEIEKAISEKVTAIKVLHGYGSHGYGGVILVELRRRLQFLKRQKKISDYFGGDKWNMFDKLTLNLLNKDKSISGDCDLNNNNPGITIIII